MNSETLNQNTLLDKLLPVLVILFALVIAAKSFVLDSLWTDEALTWWVTNAGFAEVISRSGSFQGQSPLYYLIVYLVQQAGFSSEVALRTPSILFLIISSFFLFKIAKNLFNRRTAWISILFFLSFNPVLISLSARPYAMALACALASAYFFMIWIDRGSNFYGVLSVVFLALAFYAHYLFILSGVILDLILLFRGNILKRKKALFIFTVLLIVLCLPGVSHVKHLWGVKDSLYFLKFPGLEDVFKAIFPPVGLIALISGLIAAFVAVGNPLPKKENLKSLCIVLLWAVAGPLFFYIISLLLGNSLFTVRYFLWSLPGAAIFFAYFLASARSKKAMYWMFCVAFVLLFARGFDRNWQIEDWKSAAKYLSEEKSSQVFLYSGLIESEQIKKKIDGPVGEYLNAPFEYYKVENVTAVGPNFDFTKSYIANDAILVANKKFKKKDKESVGTELAGEILSKGKLSMKKEFGLIEVFEN